MRFISAEYSVRSEVRYVLVRSERGNTASEVRSGSIGDVAEFRSEKEAMEAARILSLVDRGELRKMVCDHAEVGIAESSKP